MNIDEMAAGRELDALVAEKVMGCKIEWYGSYEGGPELEQVRRCGCDLRPEHDSKCSDCARGGGTLAHYSTDISAAWEVVERFADTHRFTFVRWFGKDGTRYAASFWVLMNSDVNPQDYCPAPTAPLAICRAALKAVL